MLSQAFGTVLDVGPGSGTQIPLFARNKSITSVYGVEPCMELHMELQRRVAKAKMACDYKILACGAETQSLFPALLSVGLGEAGNAGSVFDSIVCVRVLCSVPRMEETLQGLYLLLKPGGKLIIVEHTRNAWMSSGGSFIARALQIFYHALGWSFFVGDCHMNRDIGKAVVGCAVIDGGWQEVKLERHFGWSPLTYVSGYVVKKHST